MAKSIESRRGKRKFIDDDSHIYVFSKRPADEKYRIWVCEKRSTSKGRVWTDGLEGPVIKIVNKHNHAAQAARPGALEMIGEMQHCAKTMNERPQQIVASVISKAHSDVAAILPKKDSLKRAIRYGIYLNQYIPHIRTEYSNLRSVKMILRLYQAISKIWRFLKSIKKL